jgi:hypothetical protein
LADGKRARSSIHAVLIARWLPPATIFQTSFQFWTLLSVGHRGFLCLGGLAERILFQLLLETMQQHSETGGLATSDILMKSIGRAIFFFSNHEVQSSFTHVHETGDAPIGVLT